MKSPQGSRSIFLELEPESSRDVLRLGLASLLVVQPAQVSIEIVDEGKLPVHIPLVLSD